MRRDADDEALSWGDEGDPTYVDAQLPAPPEPAEQPTAFDPARLQPDPFEASTGAPITTDAPRRASGANSGETVVASNSAAVAEARIVERDAAERDAAERNAERDAQADAELAGAEADSSQLSSPALISFGIVGGVFFLYTIGWFVSLLRSAPDGSSLAGIVQIALTVLAVAAPVLWFAGTLFIAYRRRVWVRLAWLLVGAVVLVPWPFIAGS